MHRKEQTKLFHNEEGKNDCYQSKDSCVGGCLWMTDVEVVSRLQGFKFLFNYIAVTVRSDGGVFLALPARL